MKSRRLMRSLPLSTCGARGINGTQTLSVSFGRVQQTSTAARPFTMRPIGSRVGHAGTLRRFAPSPRREVARIGMHRSRHGRRGRPRTTAYLIGRTAVRPPHQEWATRHVPQSNTSSATIGEWAIPKPCSRQPTAKQLRRVRASTGEMGPGGCGPLPIVRNPERRTDLLRIGYDVHVMPA
jgi:hypothetical protein